MKKIIKIIIVLIIVFTSVQFSSAQGKSELKKISLIYTDHSTSETRGIIFFRDEYLPRIQKELAKIGYEIDVSYHHNESLYKLADQVEACVAGLVDITLFSIDYETERAPLHEILNMPLMGYDEYSATRTWYELNKTIPEFRAEMAGLKELAHFMVLPVVFNMNKEVRVPADFKGIKIQSAGMPAKMFKSIGAIPITQSPNDWRTSLENNLIDGIAVGITGVPMFNLQDVVKYHIEPTGDSLGLTGTAFVMNRQKFDSFSPEVQKIIDDNILWASDRLTDIEVKNLPVQEEICKKLGNKFSKLTADEMQKWYEVVKPIHENWIKEMEARGLPGKKVYNKAKQLAEEYKNLK